MKYLKAAYVLVNKKIPNLGQFGTASQGKHHLGDALADITSVTRESFYYTLGVARTNNFSDIFTGLHLPRNVTSVRYCWFIFMWLVLKICGADAAKYIDNLEFSIKISFTEFSTKQSFIWRGNVKQECKNT